MDTRRKTLARQGMRGSGGYTLSGLASTPATKTCRRKMSRPSGLQWHIVLDGVVFGRPSPLRGLTCLDALSKTCGTRNAYPLFMRSSIKAEARSPRAILTVWMSQALKTHLCFLPLQKGEEAKVRQADLMLDGSISPKKIKEALRELGWRGQRENPCFVVIPSEDVLLLIQEFPTKDPNEARIMAEGWMQGMVELDQKDHILLIHGLHRSQ